MDETAMQVKYLWIGQRSPFMGKRDQKEEETGF
jgi:hypothetical protein